MIELREPGKTVQDFVLLHRLRRIPPELVTERFSGFARRRFEQWQGLPVLVPAFNEAYQLPYMLTFLAHSSQVVFPIVVNNNSQDDSEAIARTFGALVLHEEKRGQMNALKTGLEFMQDELPSSPLLILDADCTPATTWAATMNEQMHQLESPAILTGPRYYYGNRGLDPFRTVGTHMVDFQYYAQWNIIKPYNSNMALSPGKELFFYQNIIDLIPDDVVTGVNNALYDAVLKNGGEQRYVGSNRALVYVHDRRYSNALQLVRKYFDPNYVRKAYSDRYTAMKGRDYKLPRDRFVKQ